MSRRGSLAVASVGVATLAVVALVLVVLLRDGDGGSPRSGAETPTASIEPTASPGTAVTSPSPATPAVSADEATAWLSDVDAAGGIDAETLLAAGLVLGKGPWADLAGPAWPMNEERPVYVGEGEVSVEGRVDVELVLAHRLGTAASEVVLRFLPAAEALAAGEPEVDARVNGQQVSAQLDPGGLLRVPLPSPGRAGEAVRIRLTVGYQLLTVPMIPADGGPAAFGLLANHGDTLALGHWLPVLTFEPEPIVPWGDLGAFPPAVWSLQLRYDGAALTGGAERPCPSDDEDRRCVWARGTALRDLAVVVLDDVNDSQVPAGPLLVRSSVPPRLTAAAAEVAATEAAQGLQAFERWFGPLAWPDLDIVAVPLGRGAAGMEFPGLVMIDTEAYGSFNGGFGSFVLHHETAHQYFHGLVGNGSFADPVVDEATAQYLTVLAYRDLFGEDAASRLVSERLQARYRGFRESGASEEPPAQPSGDFDSAATYGPLLYARAPLGWLAVEQQIGQDGVTQVLATLVDRAGLGWLTTSEVIAAVEEVDLDAAAVLRRYWTSPDPVDPSAG